MSNWIITVLCGLRDAFNPCVVTAVFGLLFLVSELRRRRMDGSWYAALFVAVFFVAFLAFNLGAFMPLFYSDGFYFMSSTVYFVIGILLIGAGFVHLRDWWLLKRGKGSLVFFPMVAMDNVEGGLPREDRTEFWLIMLVVAAAVILSAMSTIWPMDQYVLFYSNYLMVPGKTFESYLMMFVYCAMFAVPFLGGFLFVSSGIFSRWVKDIPSLLKITVSALTVALGTGLVYIFH